MEARHKLTFQFISEPLDVNYGGKVHGGAVMKWMDQAAYACASTWAEGYCVTVYVGGIRFYKPIKIGDLVKIDAQVIYTGETSIHISLDVYSRTTSELEYQNTTHCIMVFVAVDADGKGRKVTKLVPNTEEDIQLEQYAKRLMELRKSIEEEMHPYINIKK
jgi:acyl-CoA hydrolase